MSEVTDLIDRYKADEMTLEELARSFRARRWPRTPPPNRPSNYLEMAALAQEDPGSIVPGSFDDVGRSGGTVAAGPEANRRSACPGPMAQNRAGTSARA